MNKSELDSYRKVMVNKLGRKCHDCKRLRSYSYTWNSKTGYKLLVYCKCSSKEYDSANV